MKIQVWKLIVDVCIFFEKTEEPPTDPTPPIVAAPPGFENPPDSASDVGAPAGLADDHMTNPVVITSDDNADTVSGSSATGAEHVPQDDLQYSIMALIDYIASRYDWL